MRLIDADALAQALHEAGTVMGQPHFLCRTVYECINNAPIVDAVTVVRCKDCRHAVDYYHDGDCYCSNPKRGLNYFDGSWEFYCADAERRNNE